MRRINKHFKIEGIIRAIIAILGILCFTFSTSFGWGFILGGIVSKENISLKTKEGWSLLAIIMTVMLLAIYFLLKTPAIYGYIASTVFYFILRDVLTYFSRRNK